MIDTNYYHTYSFKYRPVCNTTLESILEQQEAMGDLYVVLEPGEPPLLIGTNIPLLERLPAGLPPVGVLMLEREGWQPLDLLDTP